MNIRNIVKNIALALTVGIATAGVIVGLHPAAEAADGCAAGTSRMAHNNAPGPYSTSSTYQQNCKLPAGTCIAVGKRNWAWVDYGPAGVVTVYDYAILDRSAYAYHDCRSEVVAGPWK